MASRAQGPILTKRGGHPSQLRAQVAPQIGGYVNPTITGAGSFPYANVYYSANVSPATYSSAADVLGKVPSTGN